MNKLLLGSAVEAKVRIHYIELITQVRSEKGRVRGENHCRSIRASPFPANRPKNRRPASGIAGSTLYRTILKPVTKTASAI
jgi:hypothetical protein